MANKFEEAAERGADLGLNADELAFYDALPITRNQCGSWGTKYSERLRMNWPKICGKTPSGAASHACRVTT
jgi:hypothetical protein